MSFWMMNIWRSMIGCFQIIFYQSAEDTVFKAFGVE